MACNGLNFKIQIIDLVQEPPPPPVQEEGRIRSGFQEAMQNHRDDTQTQRNRHNTESTRGADEHIEAPRIHPFYSTFNLKNRSCCINRKGGGIATFVPGAPLCLNHRNCSCQSIIFMSVVLPQMQEGEGADLGSGNKTVLILCQSMRWRQCVCLFFLNCAISPPSGLSVQGSSWVVGEL